MHKKISKAVKAADKTTKAAIDKVAHAKELKRIRDAKYRAAKKAAKAKQAKADKAQPKTKADGTKQCSCGELLALAGMIMMTNSLCLSAVIGHKELPKSTIKMANRVLGLNHNFISMMKNIKTKEVR